ncbi:MAG: hypothetical protein HRU42_18625 [Shewanella sp.]|nr:hypothetical protein [Shewanella sp.]
MLGTPVMETDESGYVISRSVYEPFGKRLGGEKVGLGFTGHLQDEDLGLTYMQVRYYDPLIGRFYSNDPVGFRDVHSFNRYAYGNNNPYKYTDPTGMFSNDFIDAQNQIRQLGFGEEGVIDFNVGASDVAMEASGANDLIAAGGSLASGDISGAAVSAAMAVVKPLKGLKVASRIKESSKLVKEAQVAGKSHQAGIDNLTAKLSEGNLNPGIGTKPIGQGLSEARHSSGARVYFKQSGDTIQILGKSNKANQGAVIKEVLKTFGNE